MSHCKDTIIRHLRVQADRIIYRASREPGTRFSISIGGLTGILPEDCTSRAEKIIEDPSVYTIRTSMPFQLNQIDPSVAIEFLANLLAGILESKDAEISTIPTAVELILNPGKTGEFLVTWAFVPSKS